MRASEYTVEFGEYDRNRRFEVERGTKFVQVSKRFQYDDANPEMHGEEVVKMAFREAYKRYGNFPHDLVSYTVTFVTCQVLVELRILP